jgi:hypothetical protein
MTERKAKLTLGIVSGAIVLICYLIILLQLFKP